MEQFWKSRWFVAFAYTLFGLVILFMFQQIRPTILAIYSFLKAVLTPFVVALIISYVLNPIVRLLNDRGVPRTVAVLLIYAVFVTSVVVAVMNMIPIFLKQLRELNEHLPELTMRAQGWFAGLNDNRIVPHSVREGINDALLRFEENITEAISKFLNGIGETLNMLFMAFIVPFLAFYILKDYRLIEKTVLAIVPRAHRKNVIQLVIDIDTALGNYVRGQFIVCLLVGLLSYIGYWLIGVPYPLLLASLVAVFNIIPYLGPYFGAAPAIIVASTVSLKMVLLVVLVNMIVQTLEGNVISPQVVGKTLHMHPLSIIFVLLIGGELAGIVGLILAVPFFAVLKVIVHHVVNYYIQRKTP